jgi:hypothetical protein
MGEYGSMPAIFGLGFFSPLGPMLEEAYARHLLHSGKVLGSVKSEIFP